MQESTGCDGVVVGRGCLGRPWIFAELAAAFSTAAPIAARPSDAPLLGTVAPRLGAVTAVMVRHADLLAAAVGDQAAMRDFRKHTGWYLTGYPVGAEIRRRLAAVSSLAELRDLLDRLDPEIPLPEGARRMARGHSDGPRPVALPDRWLETRDDPAPPVGADLFVSGG
jgi:tRNA-dihydrouridine synthase